MKPQDIHRFDRIGFDTETTGLRYPVDKMFGFSVALPSGDGTYVDVRTDPHREWYDELAKYKGRIICHNASFDYRLSFQTGLLLPIHQLDDTVTRACLIDEHRHDYTLDALADDYLHKRKVDIWQELAEIFGGRPTLKEQIKNLPLAPKEVVARYAIPDAALALELWEWQEDERKDQGLTNIMNFERRVMPRLIKAEMEGVRVDLNRAEAAANELTPIIESMELELEHYAGIGFNANSPKQMRELFQPDADGDGWSVRGVPIEQTKKGAPSFSKESLYAMAEAGIKEAELIIDLRSTIKTRDTFLRGHILGHAVGDRVYPTINQNKGEDGGTYTGRLSYTDPAMQQIPSRNKKVAAIVKRCFLPDEGCVWVDSDLQSFEVRGFANLINDPRINEAYEKDPFTDFHAWVAELTGLPRDPVRSGGGNAKQLNLSMIFNQGEAATATKMGMTEGMHQDFFENNGRRIYFMRPGPQAKRIIDKYHRQLPGVKKLMAACKKEARRHGYVKTAHGRHVRLEPRWYYKASGLKIQSTSADINKENWILADVLEEFGARMVLNVHDSYSISSPENTEKEAFKAFQDAVQEKGRWNVPIVLEKTGVGKTWWDAIKG